MEVDVHHHTEKEPETVEKLTRLDGLLKDLRDRINMVTEEQSYFKNRETRFRETTDSTYSRTFWIGLCKFVLLVAVSKYFTTITHTTKSHLSIDQFEELLQDQKVNLNVNTPPNTKCNVVHHPTVICFYFHTTRLSDVNNKHIN